MGFYSEYQGYKSQVSLWTVRNIYQNLAMPLTYLAIKARLSPNLITILSFVFFLIGAKEFYNSNYLYCAFFWVLSYVFDYVDGAVARATKTGSRFGAFFDVTIDRIVSVLFLTTLSLKIFSSGYLGEKYLIVFSATAIVAYAIISSMRPLYFPELKGYANNNKTSLLRKIMKIPYEALDTGNLLFLTSISFYFGFEFYLFLFYLVLSLSLILYTFYLTYNLSSTK
jgi:phosphatidylglycerophosphate synthase